MNLYIVTTENAANSQLSQSVLKSSECGRINSMPWLESSIHTCDGRKGQQGSAIGA